MTVPALHRRAVLDAGAVVLALFGAWLSLGPSRPVLPTEAPAWWWIDLVGGLLGAALLLARHRYPVVVTVVVSLLGLVVTTVWLAGAVATFAVAARRPWLLAAVLSAVSLAASPASDLVRDRTPEAASLGQFGYAVVISAVLVAWGAAVRERQALMASLVDRADRAEEGAALRAEAARAAERTRIAREMHDVLGHRLSLVSMHAAALAHRRDEGRDTDPAEVEQALAVIRGGAQEALADLRAILGVLRDPQAERDGGPDPPGDPAPVRAPQPTLADLGRLLDGVRATGTEVHLHDDLAGGTAAVPDECGRTLYRVTQEALTNAARHAPGHPVEVRLRGDPDGDVELHVSNPLPRSPVPARATGPGSGTGLLGVAERVELAGGRVLARGPRQGCFRVAVRVPRGSR